MTNLSEPANKHVDHTEKANKFLRIVRNIEQCMDLGLLTIGKEEATNQDFLELWNMYQEAIQHIGELNEDIRRRSKMYNELSETLDEVQVLLEHRHTNENS